MALDLHHTQQGSGPPLLLLHGLFGSLENLAQQARHLAKTHEVYSVDLRNHGKSPHDPRMDYPSMVEDVLRLMDQLNLHFTSIMGHSMGGKLAMQLALSAPERFDKLLVIDIAPRHYQHNHDGIFEGFRAVVQEKPKNRQEAECVLAHHIPSPGVRHFVMKNLLRDPAGGFRVRLNAEALEKSYPVLAKWPEADSVFEGPSLFIKGANSEYLTHADKERILSLFPHARAKTIRGAGHWPHTEKPVAFKKVVLNFFNECQLSQQQPMLKRA